MIDIAQYGAEEVEEEYQIHCCLFVCLLVFPIDSIFDDCDLGFEKKLVIGVDVLFFLRVLEKLFRLVVFD